MRWSSEYLPFWLRKGRKASGFTARRMNFGRPGLALSSPQGDTVTHIKKEDPSDARHDERFFHVSIRLAVSDARVALPNFYDVAIGIANVAARLTVLGLGLREELSSSTSP
jgi:hypothetical protein